MAKWMKFKRMLFINELIKNENKVSADYLKNLFSREDYRKLLENSLKTLETNPSDFFVSYRSNLYKLSELGPKIIDLVDHKRLAPGYVIDYGTLNNQEIIVHGNKQEVTMQNGVLQEDKKQMDYFTIFDLASTSKLFTAISMLQLLQIGVVDFEATVGDYTNKFPNISDVKLIDLLTFNVPIKTDRRVDDTNDFKEAEQILFSLHTYESSTPFVYTDMGCLVLKYIIEEVTGIPLKEYIHSQILMPCNMYYTFLNVPEEFKNIVANENYASYVDNNGKIITQTDIYPGKVHDAKANSLGHDLGNASGHAGWFSNVLDMSLLATNLLNGTILNEELVMMLGQYNTNINPQTSGDKPVWKYHHGLLTYLKQPNKDYLHVQPFLSGSAFISPGFAGTTFCLDPLNKIYAFSAANRLHNRIFKVPKEFSNNIYENESGEKIYRDGEMQKTICSTYTKESEELIKEAMMLTLPFKLLEKIKTNKEQMKLVREL